MVYKEGIIAGMENNVPDIILIRETLPGNSNIMSIVYDIRAQFHDVRIIFLAGNREPGDAFLNALVSYGIYDILYGENILAREIIELIEEGNTYTDVKHLQPVPLLDEESNKILFEAPKPKKEIRVIEIHKEAGEGFLFEEDCDEEFEEEYEEDDDYYDYEEPIINNAKEKEETGLKDNKNKFKIPQISKIGLRRNSEDINRGKDYQPSSSEKIITFLGGKNGVGTSSIAINFAFMLANEGKKVIYVEFDENYPSVSYWYELGIVDEGIDTFIDYMNRNEYNKVRDTIIESKEIKNKESLMQKNYKKFPDTLDFLFFSKEYLSGTKKRIDKKEAKELYLYLIYQLGYDYVILDVPSDINNEATKNALLFSNAVFSVITQDVSSVGYHLFNLNNLNKKGIDVGDKNTYILNKYENSASFNDGQVKKWIMVNDILTIPSLHKDFIDSNLMGMPLYLRGKSQSFNNSIRKIKKYL